MTEASTWTMLMLGTCFVLQGCQSAAQESTIFTKSEIPSPATEPASKECFRSAQAADLQVSLATRTGSADHFPLVTVKVYNIATEEVILAYEPGSVVIHCGDFEEPGPAPNFVRRREILRSKQPIEFVLSNIAWMRSPSHGEQDLLLPTELPPGKYAVWATFHVGSPDGPVVESPRDWYVVPVQ